jgi:hypothetical protein
MAKIERKLMKIATILSVVSAAVVLTSVGLAASYDELAAKGYRWVTVDGPLVVLPKTICDRSPKTAQTKSSCEW